MLLLLLLLQLHRRRRLLGLGQRRHHPLIWIPVLCFHPS
jgi:hypothetical protein